MNIIEKDYKWNGKLSKRYKTNYIILHHAAANGSSDVIHQAHLNNGWTGIGYHFYVRKDGSVYRGRPIDKIGAQCTGYNSQSIGICFEGNYETALTMPDAQKKSGYELVKYCKNIYTKARVAAHKDLFPTACPGKNFPFNYILNGNIKSPELKDANDIVWELHHRGIITNSQLWLDKCKPNSDSYWIAYKVANMTVNSDNAPGLSSVNDIVWELSCRNILTDTAKWIKNLEGDKDLFWLAYKAANFTSNKGV